MSWAETMAQKQNDISQKHIDELKEVAENYYSRISEEMIPLFTQVFEEVLSSVGPGQKPAPADLYNLDSYKTLYSQSKEQLDAIGYELIAISEAQFKLMYIDLYENIGLTYRACKVDDAAIQEVLNKNWKDKNWRDRIWINLSYLWDGFFKELMFCVIHNQKPDRLQPLLQTQINKSKVSFNAIINTEATYAQVFAVSKRYSDDKKDAVSLEAYIVSYVAAYWGEEEEQEYQLTADEIKEALMAYVNQMSEKKVKTMSLRSSGNADIALADYDLELFEEEEEEVWVMVECEQDDLLCDECAEWDGYDFNLLEEDPPIPVHPNCRCVLVPYGISGDYDDMMTKGVSGGGLRGFLGAAIGAIITGFFKGFFESIGSYEQGKGWVD